MIIEIALGVVLAVVILAALPAIISAIRPALVGILIIGAVVGVWIFASSHAETIVSALGVCFWITAVGGWVYLIARWIAKCSAGALSITEIVIAMVLVCASLLLGWELMVGLFVHEWEIDFEPGSWFIVTLIPLITAVFVTGLWRDVRKKKRFLVERSKQ